MWKFKSLPILAGLAALGTAAGFAPAEGSVLDSQDFQIFVCSGCTSAAGGDPNFINTGGFNIGTAQNTTNPLLVLIGEPNPGATAPTLSVDMTGATAASGMKYFLPVPSQARLRRRAFLRVSRTTRSTCRAAQIPTRL